MAVKLPAEVLAVVNKLNKKHGTGTVLLGSEIKESIPRITTGSLSLDVALNGGWVANQWNEVYGWESSGKTALVLTTIAANQKRDPKWLTAWVAAEEFSKPYAELFGVDLERIILLEENGMETAYQFAIDMLKTKSVDCIVIDSLPALEPEREEGNQVGEMAPGLGALLTGQFFRKQRPHIRRSLTESERPCTGIIVNQFREKIGVMYGDPRTTPGGRGKNFSFYSRVSLTRDEWIEEDDERVGIVIKARVEKNKGGRPQRLATLDFHFADHGEFKAGQLDHLKEIVSLGILYGVFTRKGAFYSYGENQWQGRNALIEALREDSALQKKASAAVMGVITRRTTSEPPPRRRIRPAS